MVHVLVTGASGFIGSHLIHKLTQQGFSVRAFILPETQKNFPLTENQKVETYFGDIRDYDGVFKAMQDCDYVFHLAAHCDLWASDRRIYKDINVSGTKNICKAAEKRGIKKLVFTSSCETLAGYQQKNSVNKTEEHFEREPLGPYAHSKLMAEKEVYKYIQKGHHSVIVHPTLPLGPNDWAPSPVGQLIRLFLKRKIKFYYPTGFNFVDVRDVATGLILAAIKGKSGEHYVFGGQNFTLKDFFEKLQNLSNIPAPKRSIKYSLAYITAALMELFADWISHKKPMATREGVKAARQPLYFSSAKANRELGYEPRDIDEALKEEVAFYLKHKE